MEAGMIFLLSESINQIQLSYCSTQIPGLQKPVAWLLQAQLFHFRGQLLPGYSG